MASADEHLGQIVGTTIASLLFQLAMLKAENDRLQAQLADRAQPDLIPRGA